MRWKGVSTMLGCFAPCYAKFISLVISNDVCVSFDFASGEIVVGGF
jgi:hypothetical protein